MAELLEVEEYERLFTRAYGHMPSPSQITDWYCLSADEQITTHKRLRRIANDRI